MLEMFTTEGVFCWNSFTLATSSADKSSESGSGAYTPLQKVMACYCSNAAIDSYVRQAVSNHANSAGLKAELHVAVTAVQELLDLTFISWRAGLLLWKSGSA